MRATSGAHGEGGSVELEDGGWEQQECMLKNGMFLVSGYEKLSFCTESPKFNAHQNSQKSSLLLTNVILIILVTMILILVLTLLLGSNYECFSITKRVLKLQWYGIVT